MNRTIHACLDAQASGMDPAKESDIEALLDGFEKVHHQVVRDVIAAQRKIVLVVGPTAFHQLRLESLVFEIAFLERGIDRRFTGETDKADLNMLGVNDFG